MLHRPCFFFSLTRVRLVDYTPRSSRLVIDDSKPIRKKIRRMVIRVLGKRIQKSTYVCVSPQVASNYLHCLLTDLK